MIITGGTFKLGWVRTPPTDNQVDHTTIYEHVGSDYNVIAEVGQPDNFLEMTGVSTGPHNYVAKFHNAARDSENYSDELNVMVIPLPITVANLTIIT